jgi:hypothetical protein
LGRRGPAPEWRELAIGASVYFAPAARDSAPIRHLRYMKTAKNLNLNHPKTSVHPDEWTVHPCIGNRRLNSLTNEGHVQRFETGMGNLHF